jgi:primase-polymerase (primpol)-like protein
VEIYDHTMGFAITGVRPALPDCVTVPADVVANQSGVDALYEWLVKQRGAHGRENGQELDDHVLAAPSPGMSDEEIMLRARNARNSAKFTALFDEGDVGAHGGDDSSADMALCCMLAFWTQDAAQIDRLFRKSKLARDKWDEVHYSDGTTYGARTIGNALAVVSEHYSPPDGRETEGGERETRRGTCVYQTIDLATGERQVHRGGIVCRRGGRGELRTTRGAQWLP